MSVMRPASKLTRKQQRDLATIEHFIDPQWHLLGVANVTVTDDDRRAFLAHSDRGIRPVRTPGIEALREGKKRRDWHVAEFRRDLRGGLLFAWEIHANFPADIAAYLIRATDAVTATTAVLSAKHVST